MSGIETASSSLLLNVAPIEVDDVAVEAGALVFKSREQLQELRRKHQTTHVFRRVSGDTILAIRRDGSAPDLGTPEQVRLQGNYGLACALIRESLIEFFVERSCEITDYLPLRIISSNSREELFPKALPKERAPVPWVSVRPLVTVDVRAIFPERGDSFVAACLNVRIRKRILLDCSELIQRGVQLVGLGARVQIQRDDTRMAPRLRTSGRIVSIEDGFLVTDSLDPDCRRIPAASAWLKCTPDAFGRCLQAAYDGESGRIAARLRDVIGQESTGAAKLRRVQGIHTFLAKQTWKLLPGVSFRVKPFCSSKEHTLPGIREAPTPTYVFHPSGQKTAPKAAAGLSRYGPYSTLTQTPSSPRVCVVCEAERKGEVEQFIHKFIHGVTSAGGDFSPYANGLERGYHLERVTVEFFCAVDGTPQAYHKAAQAALEKQADGDFHWDLALVQVDEGTHALVGDKNAYLVSKAAFLSQQIPVQEFETETMRYRDGQLGYSLSNMALATYAKLGGVPWLLRADPTIAHELVVGIGSSFIPDPSGMTHERIVGITTMFTGDGHYFLTNYSKAVPMEAFEDALLDALRQGMQKAKGTMNWQPGDQVRLVFHAFKPMKDREANAVKRLAAELEDYSMEFAFLHIAEDHPFILFDRQQPGKQTGMGPKGQFAPRRGLYMKLSRRDALLTMTGPPELKKVTDGMPFPLLLKLHRESTFDDLSYLAKQAFAFSCHSWRTFLPSSLPVTIGYSEQIARLLGKLSTLPRWNPDAMLGRLARSRWFL